MFTDFTFIYLFPAQHFTIIYFFFILHSMWLVLKNHGCIYTKSCRNRVWQKELVLIQLRAEIIKANACHLIYLIQIIERWHDRFAPALPIQYYSKEAVWLTDYAWGGLNDQLVHYFVWLICLGWASWVHLPGACLTFSWYIILYGSFTWGALNHQLVHYSVLVYMGGGWA